MKGFARLGLVALSLLSLYLGSANAQTDSVQKTEFHLSVGSAFIDNSYNSLSLFGIKPTFIYRPSERLAFKTSVGIMNSFSLAPNGYRIEGHQPRSLAPLRNPGSASLGSLSIGVAYKASDRLWLVASLSHFGGELPSLWNGHFAPVSATVFTASARYKLGQDRFIDINATIVDDRTGALFPYLLPSYDPLLSPIYSPFSSFMP